MNYQECDALLQGRNRNRRKIANNTYLNRYDETTINILLHNHNIVEFLANGTILYDTCGYNSRTTKDRMNRFGGASITQENYRWYAHGIEVDRTWKNTDLLTAEQRQMNILLTNEAKMA